MFHVNQKGWDTTPSQTTMRDRPGTWSDHGWVSQRVKWCNLCNQSCPNSQRSRRMEPTNGSNVATFAQRINIVETFGLSSQGWMLGIVDFSWSFFRFFSGWIWDISNRFFFSGLRSTKGRAVTRHLSPCMLPPLRAIRVLLPVLPDSVVQPHQSSRNVSRVFLRLFFAIFLFACTEHSHGKTRWKPRVLRFPGAIGSFPSHPWHTEFTWARWDDSAEFLAWWSRC